MRKSLACFAFALLGIAAILPVECAAKLKLGTPQAPSSDGSHAFHDHPPNEPLPVTLDPRPFKADRATYIAYTLAAQIRGLLYQEPCYCPCDKQKGHQSLLDCFTNDHGVHCAICRKEAILCYRLYKKKKSASEIRNAMANGKAWKFDLGKYVDHLFARLQKSDL
jgi:Protein of unknown function with PCYCGC motif